MYITEYIGKCGLISLLIILYYSISDICLLWNTALVLVRRRFLKLCSKYIFLILLVGLKLSFSSRYEIPTLCSMGLAISMKLENMRTRLGSFGAKNVFRTESVKPEILSKRVKHLSFNNNINLCPCHTHAFV